MDLTTHYMGLQLKNPLVASASPLSADLGNIRQLEDSGAAAIVLPSGLWLGGRSADSGCVDDYSGTRILDTCQCTCLPGIAER